MVVGATAFVVAKKKTESFHAELAMKAFTIFATSTCPWRTD